MNNKNANQRLAIALVLGALGVAFGAFGAHGLADTLAEHGRVETFETAVKYHFYHSFLLIILVILEHQLKINLKLPYYLALSGVLIFSGTLYVLCLSQLNWLGAITPIGGVLLIAAWLIGAVKCYKSRL